MIKATKKWLTIKISSGLLIPFMLWFIINSVSLLDANNSQLIEFLSNISNKVIFSLFLLLAFTFFTLTISEVFEDYHEFEEYIRECSHLEYVYVWDSTKVVGGKWLVATWETTKKEVYTDDGLDYEFESHWNGFESLVTVYIREGNETVTRYRKMVSEGKVDIEYLDYASELEDSVLKWNRIGVSKVAEEAFATA